MTLNSTVEKVLHIFKNEIASYFDTFFSQKKCSANMPCTLFSNELVYITSKTCSLI